MGRNGVLSLRDFAAALQDSMNVTLDSAELAKYCENLPLDEDGNVKYSEYLNELEKRLLIR